MTCPRCRQQAFDNANFCHACGFMLKPFCPLCRIKLPENAYYCFQCGASIHYLPQQPSNSSSVIQSQTPIERSPQTFPPQQRSATPTTTSIEANNSNVNI